MVLIYYPTSSMDNRLWKIPWTFTIKLNHTVPFLPISHYFKLALFHPTSLQRFHFQLYNWLNNQQLDTLLQLSLPSAHVILPCSVASTFTPPPPSHPWIVVLCHQDHWFPFIFDPFFQCLFTTIPPPSPSYISQYFQQLFMGYNLHLLTSHSLPPGWCGLSALFFLQELISFLPSFSFPPPYQSSLESKNIRHAFAMVVRLIQSWMRPLPYHEHQKTTMRSLPRCLLSFSVAPLYHWIAYQEQCFQPTTQLGKLQQVFHAL